MGWETVKKGGKILIDSRIPDGKSVRITNDLLQEFLQQFIRASRKFYEFAGVMPFVYRERQLNSTVFTAFSNAADIAFLEHPVTRLSEDKEKKYGWLDYWVLYRNTVFLVELKHHFNALATSSIRRDGVKTWQTGVSQIQGLANVEDLNGDVNGIVKLALMVVVNYEGFKGDRNPEMYRGDQFLEEPWKQYKSFVHNLSPAPNWSATWHLHKDLREPREVLGGGWEFNPTVDFFALAEVVPLPVRKCPATGHVESNDPVHN